MRLIDVARERAKEIPQARKLVAGLRHVRWLVLNPINWLVRRILHVIRKVLLLNHWDQARSWWPELSRLELTPLVIWSASLRVHHHLLNMVWQWASRYRSQHPGSVTTSNRVLHVAASFDLGGTQTQIRNLCVHADALVHHQAIEVFPEKNYLYRRGETVHPEWYVWGSWWRRAAGRLVSEYRSRSAQLVHIYKLYCDFLREKPDIVVGWGHEVSAVTFAAAAFAGVPHIVFCIRTVNPRYYAGVDTATERRLWRAHRAMIPFVSRTIVNSTLLRDDYSAWLGTSPDAITVCANGILIDIPGVEERHRWRAAVRAKFGIADSATVILSLGRFSEEKGQQLLVDADRRLRDLPELPNTTWLLFGDGPTLPAVRQLAAAHHLDNMIFAGRTDAAHEALSAADLFVMPSDFEGMPNAMMEAMSFGLPCVSTNVTGALDIARDGIEALYCPPGDGAALAERIEALLRDPSKARELGDAAARRIGEFSVARSQAAFDRAFAPLLRLPLPD